MFGVNLATAGSASASSLQFQLDPGDSLGPNESIWSDNNAFVSWMSADGNFITAASGGPIFASTSTGGHPGAILKMQTDGNLVVIAPGNVPIWDSGTAGHPGTVLQLQFDGGLVLYAPGHIALKVVVPRLFDPNNSVPTPRLQPNPEADSEPSLLRETAVDGGKLTFCSGAGKVIEATDKVPHGKIAGIVAEQACASAAKGETPKANGYSLTVLATSVLLGPVGPAFALFFDDPEAAG
ncbi:hypothetical protein [Frankia tisae]|uniref:hypothetical protein n=1 Tax=Frankia tisae TaxID=2950104 RepID=UPI0021C130BC|nr:hypothetical protein [Frankia tisae]